MYYSLLGIPFFAIT